MWNSFFFLNHQSLVKFHWFIFNSVTWLWLHIGFRWRYGALNLNIVSAVGTSNRFGCFETNAVSAPHNSIVARAGYTLWPSLGNRPIKRIIFEQELPTCASSENHLSIFYKHIWALFQSLFQIKQCNWYRSRKCHTID